MGRVNKKWNTNLIDSTPRGTHSAQGIAKVSPTNREVNSQSKRIVFKEGFPYPNHDELGVRLVIRS